MKKLIENLKVAAVIAGAALSGLVGILFLASLSAVPIVIVLFVVKWLFF